jgi:hypothetical protein
LICRCSRKAQTTPAYHFDGTDEFDAAIGGLARVLRVGARQGPFVHRPVAEAGASTPELGSPTVLREFLPISASGKVQAVIGIWRDAVPILARLDGVRRDVVAVTLSASIVVSILLFLIFRSAQGRLTRQTAALVEASRRDPLTGLLNHGALVAHLATEVEPAIISTLVADGTARLVYRDAAFSACRFLIDTLKASYTIAVGTFSKFSPNALLSSKRRAPVTNRRSLMAISCSM